MEILLAVVLTILVLGLGLSLFLQFITIVNLQQKLDKLAEITANQNVITHNQQQVGQLLSNIVLSINGLTMTVDDLVALSEGYGFPQDFDPMDGTPMPEYPPFGNSSPEYGPSTESFGSGMHTEHSELTDDEIKFLHNLLKKDEETENDD